MTNPANTFTPLTDADALLEFDQRHIWHPYSSATNPTPTFVVERCEGSYIELSDGQKLIDGMGSWWCTIHGYNHPRLNAAAEAQLKSMSHVMFGGLTHRPAVELCQKLVALTPPNLERVFLADSGSVAVEVALKMAIQYQASRGKSSKAKILTVRRGYHGDTFGAMSTCDPVNGMHHLFARSMPTHFFAEEPPMGIDRPLTPHDLASARSILEVHHEEIAALIIEPIVQGAGGMRFYSPEYLRALKALCEEFDILMIADEIATGFGRTGQLFAVNHADVQPDIMCLGKAITGGYMTLAATLCSEEVATTISHGEAGVFMHGPTFMGNPLACAVACESIDLLLETDWQSNLARIAAKLEALLGPLRSADYVADVRVLGAIGVIELENPVSLNDIQPALVAEGIWLRPFGKLVYMMPPFNMSDEELSLLCRGTANVLEKLHNS